MEVEGRSAEGAELIDTPEAGAAAIRGGLLRTASFVGGLLLTLASAPLLVRHLGDADFGRYSAVLAVIGIVAGLTEGGVNTIALRELAAAGDVAQRGRTMRDLMGLRLVLSSAGAVLAVGFASAAGYSESLVLGTAVAALGMVLALTQTLVAAVLQARLRFGWAAVIEFLRAAVSTGLIVTLVLLDAGVLAFLAVAVPAGLASLLITVVLVRGSITLRPAFHPRRWMPLLRDTIVFAIAIAVNTLYFRVTLVIMTLVTTAVQTGYFALSYRVMEVLIGVPVLLIGAAFPIISRSVRTDRARFAFGVARIFELGLFTGVLTAICLFLAAPFAIELLVGDADHPSVVILQIQSPAIIASFVAAATGFPLLSMHRHRETLIANVVSLIVAAGLTLTLAPGMGARGAAVAALTAEVALAVTNTLMLMRRDGPRLPLGAIPVALVAGVTGLAAGTFVGLHPLVEAAAAGLAFLLALRVMGRFPPEVAELLRHRRHAGGTA